MSKEKISNINKGISSKILRYPLNGRSNYLIDKFYIFGYDYITLKKYLYNDDTLKTITNDIDKKQNRLLIGEEEAQKFNLSEPPTLINEFSSDYEKECLDIDMIREMIIPNKINLFYIEDEKSNDKKSKKKFNNITERKSDDKSENFFCIFDETDNCFTKEIKNQTYNVVFSSNPQSGNNSKKSINGLAYIYYKKLREEKNYLNKYYSFFVPIIFCIISEFPFYNSFHLLCQQISDFFSSYEIRMPLEVIIHDLINLTPSPINADIYLSLDSIKNLDITSKTNLKKDINAIEEEDDCDENDYKDNKDNEKKNKDSNAIISQTSNLTNQIAYRHNDRHSDKVLNYMNLNNSKNDEKNNSEIKDKRTRRTVISKRTDKGINIQEISNLRRSNIPRNSNNRRSGVSNILNHIKRSSISFLENIIFSNNPNVENKIKFEYLTGYPVIQYNLAKILLQTLSPIDVIDIFLYTFLEKDVLFFSKDLEFLSLTINSYLNLNFPLNDEKYYFINACVSYDNYINGNSTFVGSTFTTIIGINDSYNQKYQNESMNKLKEHLAVDLDNGKVYKIDDKNDKEKSKNNKELFNFIKNACKIKESKNEQNILSREINILNKVLSDIYSKMREKMPNEEDNILFNIFKASNYISYDKNIKNINLKIQDSFYRFINNISLYFYQNLSIKTEGDDPKINQKKKNSGYKEEEMNVIFLDQYKYDNIYCKEELYFLEELRETMKFQSFVFGFVQSYNPIDLYKIPLTFTEEFISIISRKSCILDKEINFLSLIDKLYQGESHEEIEIDFEQILVDYYSNYKNLIDREIEDICAKNALSQEKIKLKVYNSYKKIIKHRGHELDDRILVKYLHRLNEVKDKEHNLINILEKRVKDNVPKEISVTDIESVIENYAIETGILSENDLCCANIIILFTLTLDSLKSIFEYQEFLGSLFQYFIVFRKYYSMIMSMIYTIFEQSIDKKDIARAKDYFYLYYLCINSFRNFKLIPNESLMNIIKKFNRIDINSLQEIKEEQPTLSSTKENNNIILSNEENLQEDDISNISLYVTHNFTGKRTYKEEEIINNLNNPKNCDNRIYVEGDDYIKPIIKFNNGITQLKSFFYSQKQILSTLVEDYKNYIIDMDKTKLRSKVILDTCLNIFIFMRNSKEFQSNSDIIETVKKIFYIFLNQLQIFKK